MKQFKSTRYVQTFLSVHTQVANIFYIPYPDYTSSPERRALREWAFAVWKKLCGTGLAA